MATADLKAALEAVLFIADQPLSLEKLSVLTEMEAVQLLPQLEELITEYRLRDGGFLLEEVAGGYQFRTSSRHADLIRRLGKSRPFKFSRAALESLAIVAYRQPITRAEIEYLRGVDSGGVLKTLLDKRLIRILGKKDIAGRPLIYGTTKEFLEVFGLTDLGGLPSLKEFSELESDISTEGGELPSSDVFGEASAADVNPSNEPG